MIISRANNKQLNKKRRAVAIGYTHYFYTKPTLSLDKWDKFIDDITALLNSNTTVQREYDDDSFPIANFEEVRFNGIGDNGHETFLIKREDKPADWAENKDEVFNSCKTASKPYDCYVTATLVLAKINLGDEIKLSSDGNIEDWNEGLELIKSNVGKTIEIVNEDSESIGDATIREVVKA